jgi:hypothetical protein
MPKSTNRGKEWTSAEVKKLRELAKKHLTTAEIGLKLQRTKSGVRHKANDLKISLKPVVKSQPKKKKK